MHLDQTILDQVITYSFYAVVFVYYSYTSESIFDLTLLSFLFVTGVLLAINYASDRLSANIKDIGKFVGHILFLCLIIAISGDMIKFIYQSIFYFGFIKTVIFFNIAMMSFLSGATKLMGEEIHKFFSKNHLGRKLLDLINYYYNTYIVTESTMRLLTSTLKYFTHQILIKNARIIFNNLLDINDELTNNSRSNKVINELDKKYKEVQKQTMEIATPYVMKGIMKSLQKDPFGLNQIPKTYKNKDTPILKINEKVNSESDMDLFKSKQVEDVDDDLDEITEETETISTEAKSSTDVSNSTDQSFSEKSIDTTFSTDAKSQSLSYSNLPAKSASNPSISNASNTLNNTTDSKKKIRETIKAKEAQRAGKGVPAVPKNARTAAANNMPDIANLMQTPGMAQMMESMMKGDNLKNLMEQFPPEKMGLQMPKIQPEQMKNLLKQISKK